MTVDDWDLIVVGAGIVGCSTAYYAAKRGMRVLVLERETPGSAQSGRNLGFVRQQGRDFRELSLAIGAMKLWEGMEAELGRKVGWCRGGNLALASNEADMARQEEWQVRALDFGLDTQLLTAEQVSKKLPLLSPNATIEGAMYTASDGKAEPGRVTRAYFEAAVELGVSFRLGASVSRFDSSTGRITGVWSGGQLHRARTVLCAAGAGSGRLLRTVGLHLPQEQIRATVVRTMPRPELRIASCVSGPLTGIRQDVRGAYVISVAGGEYDVRWDSCVTCVHMRRSENRIPMSPASTYGLRFSECLGVGIRPRSPTYLQRATAWRLMHGERNRPCRNFGNCFQRSPKRRWKHHGQASSIRCPM